VDDAIRAWVESAAGGRITTIARPEVGGSSELYFVDVEHADGTVVPLVVRCEAGGSFSGTEIAPAKEAVVYRALEPTSVPVPRVIGLAPEGAALLLERVRGNATLDDADEAERAETLAAFVDALAALHRLDVDALDLPGFARPGNAAEHALFRS
jgi:aminoglycoside phosphotransferase (APT) family kinase protein